MSSMLQFLTMVGKLKELKRRGWVLRKIEDPETVSGHMYRMAIMAMVSTIPDLNRDKCIKMCLVHDIAECIVGDIAPSDNVPKQKKKEMEMEAFESLCCLLEDEAVRNEFKSLFLEYEEQASNEAVFVKDLDMFDMILQAKEYEDKECDPVKLQEFFDGVEGRFKTDIVKKFVADLKTERTTKIKSSNLTR